MLYAKHKSDPPGNSTANLRAPLGNRGQSDQNPVWHLLATSKNVIQTKLTVGAPDDPHEQEADRVADQVMRAHPSDANGSLRGGSQAHSSRPFISSITAFKAQRKCGPCEEEDEQRVQRQAVDGGNSTGMAEPIVGVRGHQLDAATRLFMEPRFGRDFSNVRVHTDDRADAAARQLNSFAFTLGSDVVFRAGHYAPHSEPGRRLLAHELAHVTQSGSKTIHRQSDQTEEGRGTMRGRLGQYIAEMRFAKVINDCPADSGVRLLDALMRIRGRVDRNTQCLEFFRRRLGVELLPMLSPYRPPSVTIDPSLTGSGHARCPPRAEFGHPPPVSTIRLGPSLCTSPHLDRVIIHELAHQTGCAPTGNASAWDESVANQASDICIGTVQEQLQLRDQAAAVDPAASPEDWNFTGQDLRSLQQRRTQLRFAADSNWFPAPLRENLRNTIIYLLAPSSAEARTQGINPTDLFHGHLVVPHGADPQSLLSLRDAWTQDLVSTRQRVLSPEPRVTDQNLAAYRGEVGRLSATSGPLLNAAVRQRGAAVIYHTFEFAAPGSPQAQIQAGSPRRNFRTPLFTNVPEPYSAPDPDNASSYQRDYTHIYQFSFLVDRMGVIHVRPDFRQELSDVTGTPMTRQPN